MLNNIKAPYNVSTPTAALALRALSPQGLSQFRQTIATLNDNRTWLSQALLELPSILQILGKPDANFILAQVGTDGKPDNAKAQRVYKKMASEEKVVVRFRGNEIGCEACLRITVGTKEECEQVIKQLAKLLE